MSDFLERLNILLGAAFHKEPKVDPEEETATDHYGPGDPDVGRC